MKYLLRTNTSYEHLAKKFERTVLTCVGRDGSEIAVCLRRFFVRWRFLASESGLYELASTFCHVPPELSTSFDQLVLDLELLVTAPFSKIFEELVGGTESRIALIKMFISSKLFV